jgi:hypothetical protein
MALGVTVSTNQKKCSQQCAVKRVGNYLTDEFQTGALNHSGGGSKVTLVVIANDNPFKATFINRQPFF